MYKDDSVVLGSLDTVINCGSFSQGVDHSHVTLIPRGSQPSHVLHSHPFAAGSQFQQIQKKVIIN